MDSYILDITETLHGRLPIPLLHIPSESYDGFCVWLDKIVFLPKICISPTKIWDPDPMETLTMLFDQGVSPELFLHIFSLAENIAKIIVEIKEGDEYKYHSYDYDCVFYDYNSEIIRGNLFGTLDIYGWKNKTPVDFGFVKITESICDGDKCTEYRLEKNIETPIISR